MKRTPFLFLCLAWASTAGAVELSGLFCDGMVFQQGQPVPVWGWAEPGEPITVEFAGQKQSCLTDPDGKWRVTLNPLKASAEEQMLEVKGRTTISVKEALVGEVWLCSGQSNMAMDLADADGAKEEMNDHPDRLLRAFRVPERPGERPSRSVNSEWTQFTLPKNRNWSATPYFFGKQLRQELGVPVGLVVCAWGGSSAVSWMSPQALSQFGPLLPEEVANWRINIQHSRLFNGMLSPLIPCAIAGVVWYQGETEAVASQNAFLYRQIFPALIQDWRTLWNRPELPFYFVQLPYLKNHPNWSIVRESQTAALKLPATGMISTIDIGQETQLHPSNKNQFGERLGNLVLAKSYARNTWPGAPVFETMKILSDGSVRLQFGDAAGLRTNDGTPPRGFHLAAEDGEFHPAHARIEGETVLVSSKEVSHPAQVRYGWAESIKASLVNAAGLPLAPFRTDDRLVEGQEWHWETLPAKASLKSPVKGSQLSQDSAPGWKFQGQERDKLIKERRLREHGTICQIAVTNPKRSPMIRWTTDSEKSKELDASKGITVEAKVHIYQATNPFHGFEIEAGIAQPDGSFRRYVLSIVPMRLYCFQEGETRLLRSNMENTTRLRSYRLAIRPDGIAQIYLDGEPVGLCKGETLPGSQTSYLRVGKQSESGEFTVTVHEISVDSSGAYASSPR